MSHNATLQRNKCVKEISFYATCLPTLPCCGQTNWKQRARNIDEGNKVLYGVVFAWPCKLTCIVFGLSFLRSLIGRKRDFRTILTKNMAKAIMYRLYCISYAFWWSVGNHLNFEHKIKTNWSTMTRRENHAVYLHSDVIARWIRNKSTGTNHDFPGLNWLDAHSSSRHNKGRLSFAKFGQSSEPHIWSSLFEARATWTGSSFNSFERKTTSKIHNPTIDPAKTARLTPSHWSDWSVSSNAGFHWIVDTSNDK